MDWTEYRPLIEVRNSVFGWIILLLKYVFLSELGCRYIEASFDFCNINQSTLYNIAIETCLIFYSVSIISVKNVQTNSQVNDMF